MRSSVSLVDVGHDFSSQARHIRHRGLPALPRRQCLRLDGGRGSSPSPSSTPTRRPAATSSTPPTPTRRGSRATRAVSPRRIIGKWAKSRGNRADVVIATKVSQHPEYQGLTAANIKAAADASLARLDTDYIDLYYTHFDKPEVPVEEIIGALDDLVKAGKVRAIAASNITPERLKASLDFSTAEGLARYVALQPHYNLVSRDTYEGPLQDRRHRRGPLRRPVLRARHGLPHGQVPPRHDGRQPPGRRRRRVPRNPGRHAGPHGPRRDRRVTRRRPRHRRPRLARRPADGSRPDRLRTHPRPTPRPPRRRRPHPHHRGTRQADSSVGVAPARRGRPEQLRDSHQGDTAAPLPSPQRHGCPQRERGVEAVAGWRETSPRPGREKRATATRVRRPAASGRGADSGPRLLGPGRRPGRVGCATDCATPYGG